MYDYILIGGGIVGLATARRLKQTEPQARILLLEKEAGLNRHQTGHNSGVIHAGVYYAPGSLKARFCIAGNRATRALCADSITTRSSYSPAPHAITDRPPMDNPRAEAREDASASSQRRGQGDLSG